MDATLFCLHRKLRQVVPVAENTRQSSAASTENGEKNLQRRGWRHVSVALLWSTWCRDRWVRYGIQVSGVCLAFARVLKAQHRVFGPETAGLGLATLFRKPGYQRPSRKPAHWWTSTLQGLANKCVAIRCGGPEPCCVISSRC